MNNNCFIFFITIPIHNLQIHLLFIYSFISDNHSLPWLWLVFLMWNDLILTYAQLTILNVVTSQKSDSINTYIAFWSALSESEKKHKDLSFVAQNVSVSSLLGVSLSLDFCCFFLLYITHYSQLLLLVECINLILLLLLNSRVKTQLIRPQKK